MSDMPNLSAFTLVIVDMQPPFEASHDANTMQAVMREIDRAEQLAMPIIVVESPEIDYFICTQRLELTHESIIQRLDRYGNYVRAKKYQSNGGYTVRITCEQEGFPQGKLRVVGVNTDICVLETVVTLAQGGSQVEVVKDACNTIVDKDCWGKFAVSPNIVLIEPAQGQHAA